MTRTLTLGYSPCPNDTYIFYGLVHNKVSVPGCAFQEQLEDVETLNRMAREQRLDVTKVSYHAVALLREHYGLLRSGGALGRGCGPLIVSRPGLSRDRIGEGVIAVPGTLTTAYLLLRLFNPAITQIAVMPFDRIMDSVARGEVQAGLIIHESRFTYPRYGLEQVADLGEWWEGTTGLPIPLGGILARRDLGRAMLVGIDRALRASLEYARTHESEVLAYCRRHSQEMDEQVMKSHIDLYVNDFSLDLGEEGFAAIERLFTEAEKHGLIPRNDLPLLAAE